MNSDIRVPISWTVDVTTIDGAPLDTVTGTAAGIDDARDAAVAAARAALSRMPADSFPCYILSFNGQVAGFVGTGALDDDTGPDHAAADAALAHFPTASILGPTG